MTSRLSDSDYVTTDQEDSRAADAELDDLRPRDTQECPVKMAKLGVSMHACMIAYLTACLTACMRDLTAGFNVRPPDCRRHWQVPHLQEGQRRRQRQCRKLHQLRKESWKQQQLQLQQQQPDGRSAPTTSTDDDHRAGAQLHPSQDMELRLAEPGTPGALGGGPDQPPGGPGGTTEDSKWTPCLGGGKGFRRQHRQHPRPNLRPRPLRHDIVIFGELGLDAGAGLYGQADNNNTCLQTDSRSQPELMSQGRSERKATPPPAGIGASGLSMATRPHSVRPRNLGPKSL
jgi:hypothetical protein